MTAHPNDRPDFLCSACNNLICDDCASTAAEYEFLYKRQKLELMKAQAEMKELHREIERLQRDVGLWESVSKVGYHDTIQAWIDSEVEKAKKAGRETARREMKKSGLFTKIAELERIANEAKKYKS